MQKKSKESWLGNAERNFIEEYKAERDRYELAINKIYAAILKRYNQKELPSIK